MALHHNSPVWNVYVRPFQEGSFFLSNAFQKNYGRIATLFWGVNYPEPVISSNNVQQTQCQFPKLWYYRHCRWCVNSLPGLSLSSGNYTASCHTPTKWQFFQVSFSVAQGSLKYLLAWNIYVAIYQNTNQKLGDSLKPMPQIVDVLPRWWWDKEENSLVPKHGRLYFPLGVKLDPLFSSFWYVLQI